MSCRFGLYEIVCIYACGGRHGFVARGIFAELILQGSLQADCASLLLQKTTLFLI